MRDETILPLSRRAMLRRAGAGFGMLGLAGALESAGLLGTAGGRRAGRRRPAALRPEGEAGDLPVHERRAVARRHVRPEAVAGAVRRAGADRRARRAGRPRAGGLMPSPFRFRPHGESGVVMSELFPDLAQCADDLCVLRSMHTDQPNHEPGLLIMNSGHPQPTRPSLGSWASYGLGTENQNLPAFVVLCPGLPVVGPQLWSSAFLPGEHQGMTSTPTNSTSAKMVANLRHPRLDRSEQRRQLDLLQRAERPAPGRPRRADDALETQVKALEMAFQMQTEASEAFDVAPRAGARPRALRPDHLRPELPAGPPAGRARGPVRAGLLRLEERQAALGHHTDNDKQHRTLCADSDRATAALLTDLKRARAAGGHPGHLGRRVRPHAVFPAGARRGSRAATTTPPASRCSWPAAASRGAPIHGADRRVRHERRRGPRPRPRPARHHPAPARASTTSG